MRGVSSGGLDDGWFRGLAGKRLLGWFFWVWVASGVVLGWRALVIAWAWFCLAFGPFGAGVVGGRGVVGCVLSREVDTRAPRHPRFILLGSFIDPLLVVSILEIVYDCHL